MDDYERLRERLDANPAGAPPAAAIGEILRILFTPEEAAVALGMAFTPRDPETIAREAGVPIADVPSRCEAMADRGVVFAREKDGRMGYALLPVVPGIFEFPFLKSGVPNGARLGELWQAYHRQAFGDAFAGKPTPLTRVIPVNRAIDGRPEVLPFEVLPTMLERNQVFALGQCACRVSVGACDKPREVCLFFDRTARFLIDRGFAREIDRVEAVAVARRAAAAGLVHSTTNCLDRLGFLCNCCPCCCTLLRTLTQLGNPNALAVSRWHAVVEPSLCNGCGACEAGRCPVGAMRLVDGVAAVDGRRCIGCGLCHTACPTDAVSMRPRPAPPQTPATVATLSLEVATEKGKLERLRRLL